MRSARTLGRGILPDRRHLASGRTRTRMCRCGSPGILSVLARPPATRPQRASHDARVPPHKHEGRFRCDTPQRSRVVQTGSPERRPKPCRAVVIRHRNHGLAAERWSKRGGRCPYAGRPTSAIRIAACEPPIGPRSEAFDRIAPLRQPRSRLAQGDAGSDRIEVIRFDWKVKTGIQPVMLVTRRRLD